MNTGEKNVLGRTILKGPKGGTYVLTAGGTKLYKFKAAPAPAPANNVVLTYKGETFTKTNYKSLIGEGRVIYRKNRTGMHFTHHPENKTMKVFAKKYSVKNSAGTIMALGNHLKARAAPAPVRAAPVPAPPPASVIKLPTPTPRPVISTAERNRRLAEIRRRLNALRAARIAALPKARRNVENRLRRMVRRTRARIGRGNVTRGHVTSRLRILYCHAPAKVPRQGCSMKTAEIQVYRDVPLIKSGAALGMDVDDFDLDWFRRQNQYISKLSDYDFWTVQAHTNRSHHWIGPYSRDGKIPTFRGLGGSTHLTPLWPQIRKLILNGTYRSTSGWVREFKNTSDESDRYRLVTRHLPSVTPNIKREALEMYKKDLKRIIAHAPKSRKKMILYRGTGFDIFKGTPGHWHTLKSFCSAAYNIGWAKAYGPSIMERITILPGTAVLLVAGTNQWGHDGEYEIMVNVDTKYLIRFRNVLRHVYEVGKYIEKRKVTDVIITK